MQLFPDMFKGKEYPTLLKGGEKLPHHDDWDCVEDAEREGLLFWVGSGLNPAFVLTEKGLKILAALRAHKARGGNFASFAYEEEDKVA
jgi:hypothetical protein